ncbi:MAG: GNAT family N-acetyltransferase [Promethearchaeota archaeon]
MENILKKVSTKSINYYIEKNLDDFYTKASTHSNFSSHLEKKISWIVPKKADWPEAIFRANFDNLNIENEITIIKKLIQEKQAPNGWTVGPLTKPENLGKFLEKNGFSNVYQQVGMALDLEDLKKQVVDNSELIVEIVEDTEQLKRWVEVVSSVFDINVDFELMEFLLLEPEASFYIGNLNGKPVSALMLYLSSGVAGLHAVSTLKEYRSRGYGLAISRMALLDAFKIGYKIGVLQASSLGERVYRKMGFQKYCDIITYEFEENKINSME